jgi:hypothetical protein
VNSDPSGRHVRGFPEVVAESEDDGGDHHPAEEEADHERDQRTHVSMLGR